MGEEERKIKEEALKRKAKEINEIIPKVLDIEGGEWEIIKQGLEYDKNIEKTADERE